MAIHRKMPKSSALLPNENVATNIRPMDDAEVEQVLKCSTKLNTVRSLLEPAVNLYPTSNNPS